MLQRKERKMGARIDYACREGHVSSNSLASFKNKKSTAKGDFTKFCAMCNINTKRIVNGSGTVCAKQTQLETTSPNVQNKALCSENEALSEKHGLADKTSAHGREGGGSECNDRFGSGRSVPDNHKTCDTSDDIHPDPRISGDTVRDDNKENIQGSQGAGAGVHVQEVDRDIRRDNPQGNTSSTNCSVEETDNVQVPCHTVHDRYRDLEPEFYNVYAQRRDCIAEQYNEIGHFMWRLSVDDAYVAMAVDYIKSHRNMFTKDYITNGDLIFDTHIYVERANLVVDICTNIAHNLDPEYFGNKYKTHYSGHVMIILINNYEITDIWYFINGKKPFSMVHKHAFDPCKSVFATKSSDEIEYVYFEKGIFELEHCRVN